MRNSQKGIVGIDEVGRGPIAGPLLICALYLPEEYDHRKLVGIRDSKKLSAAEREEWFAFAKYERARGLLTWSLCWTPPAHIDTKGMAWALRRSVNRTLATLPVSHEEVEVFLDGSLFAPKEYRQQTIVRGDDTVPAISLASNIAKVVRDKRMALLSERYPGYGFEKHKGYGTKGHYAALKRKGPSEIHRLSFLSNFQDS